MIVDVNTLFGNWQRDTLDRSLTNLLQIMQANGLTAALTCSGRGVWDSFREGNEETLAACRRHPQLWPVATIRPGDWYHCREEIASLRERGFRMVRLFPQVQQWAPEGLAFTRLVEDFVEAGLPLFWDAGYDATGLLGRVIDLFEGSDLPLIFSGVSYNLAEFLSACEIYDACYCDLWQSFLLNQLEIVRDTVGIEHLLLGSRAPFDMPGPCLEMVRHSRLTAAEKQQVLGGNLLALLGESAPPSATASEVLPPVPPTGPPAQSLIDVHAHYGPWVGLPNPATSVEDLLETCHRFRIEHCCLSSTLAIGYALEEGNERLREVISGHPQLHGYVVIHPGYVEASLAQMRELLAEPNFVGAKLHPKHCGYQADAPEARPLLAALQELGKPLLVHTWFVEMCEAMGRAADLFPDLPLIMGHMGGDDWEVALEVAAVRPNLYLELCSGLSPWGKLERAVSIVGAERLLYGSDLTLLDPGYTLGQVTGSALPPHQQRMILYENARRLFEF